jgi:multidrug efflux pump subunit AcrA (membrane-fusion protein)
LLAGPESPVEKRGSSPAAPNSDEVSIMRFLRTRRALIAAILLLVVVPATYLLARDKPTSENSLVSTVKRGDFTVTVTTSGELRAPKFVQVQLPPNAMTAQVFNGMKILSLVPEGTVVKEGEKVAEIDRSPLATKHTEVTLSLQKVEAQYEQAMLDSTLNLGKAREDMKTMELSLEEKKIAKEQAVYEAPSVKRSAELDYEKPSARWRRPRSTTRRRPSRRWRKCVKSAPIGIASATCSRTSWT